MALWNVFFISAIISTVANELAIADDLSSVSDVEAAAPLNDSPVPRYEGVKTKRRKRPLLFPGGCKGQPEPPVNGALRCSTDSGCIATCERGYKFPNGVPQLAITCSDKEWHIHGTDWLTVPHCEPICIPECTNKGVCVAPHQCNCPEDFSGPQCQFENKPCMNYPAPVFNSRIHCNSKFCTISCKENFTFPDGSAATNLICQNGNWEQTRQDWATIPNCEPVCSPPCQNGGNCLPSNYCQCPQAFKGPQCQYSSDACSGEKLGFNGGYSCNETAATYSCTINCPSEVEFQFPPASAYVCDYKTGVFMPQPIPQCKYSENMNVISLGTTYNSYVKETNQSWVFNDFLSNYTNELFQTDYNLTKIHGNSQSTVASNQMVFGPSNNGILLIQEKKPIPETCFTWGGVHYKTFDDSVFTFNSECSHVLVQEAQNRLFTVTVENSKGCKHNECSRIINIFIQDKQYILQRNDAGFPEFRTPKKLLPIPAQLSSLRVDMSAHFIVVSLDSLGVSLKWDGMLMVQIEALENMWNNTVGLCGNMNGDKKDDFTSRNGEHTKSVDAFVTSWRAEGIGGICDEYPDLSHSCKTNPMATESAIQFCTQILSDTRFQACSNTISVPDLRVACLWDYCSCKEEDSRKCACETMNVYIRQCAHKKVVSLSGWRNSNTCPMTCSEGRVYMPCGKKREPSCWTEVENQQDKENCEEGCFCPSGTVAHQGKCIYQEECPCRLRGKLFEPGRSVQKDCNTCTCSAGKWICTQAKCSARCAVIGDPHYTTFDGRHYDFMGKCKYYLMKGDDYSIEGENVPCSGAISENMGLVPPDAPSCTKTVTINYKDTSVKLKQHRQVLINGDDLTVFPTTVNGIRIRVASSIFLVVQLPNGLAVWWDGISRVYVNAPPEFHGKTKGLCGTFSENQKDDFITPEGDVENSAVSFANKWKSDEVCANVPEKEADHPCDLDPQKKAAAKQYCSYLHSDIFAGCHWHVDPETFYKDCLFDMCSCNADLGSCLCPTLAAYAKDCAAAGIKLLWRQNVDECKIHCPGSQVYQICGNSCTRSCGDISAYKDCQQECVEGCNCPEGQTLDVHGECIPMGQCPCIYGDIEFQAGHKEIRPGNKALELCTCAGGLWNCREATQHEIVEYPAAKDLQNLCVESKHQQVSDCVPAQPRTCHNMHEPVRQPAVCKSGCVCQPGYVLSELGGICIKEKLCPCHHGGQSYKEGSVIQNECNTCQCSNGTWICTDRTCAGICSAWGDSHYKTFDGKIYDFQGICDYILVKGSLSPEDFFDVSIQNVPCGTTGVACSKSITLTIGGSQNVETIVLTRGKDLPNESFKRIAVRTAGLFAFIDVPDMGLSLQWDRGTRVYVKLEPIWKGRTKGLCGDYNDNSEDDFKTPSGGISEASVNLFGDSWKRNEFCPEPKEVKDTCEQHPERNLWAVQKCGILKSPIFQPCHSEVEVESYLNNCIFDTCGCDTGGDCECLCTALAAYAQECNLKGVPIKWRSQDLCPIQCDESCSSYSPCITTCPRETCDNVMTLKDKYRLCSQDTCIEGCSIKSCPENQVYSNDSYTECVPKETCKTPCKEIDGILYYEGDNVKNDNCQTCTCSRGQLLCKGEVCTTISPSTVPQEQAQKCTDGWTAWINQDPAIKGQKVKDIEPLPSTLVLASIKGSAMCDRHQMVDIRCRTISDHLTAKQTGLDAACSLERGLYCQSHPDLPCVDFEISVLCQCSPGTTKNLETPTTPKSTYEECNMNEEPYKADPVDCHVFYQCMPGLAGNEFAEKSCGPDMLYNPQAQVCDWPANVIQIRPECGSEQTTIRNVDVTKQKDKWYNTTTTVGLNKTVITTTVCQEGETWSPCAIDCSKVCDYYKYILIKEGKCGGDSSGCVPGCVPLDKPQCLPQEFWRDAITCVDEADCTCRSHNGHPVIPSAVLKESDCEICQCINNYYTCDRSPCTTISEATTEKPVTPIPAEVATTLPSSPSWPGSTPIVVVPSTVSTPVPCVSNNFVPLIEYMKDEVSFDASNTDGSLFLSENALENSNTKFWEPKNPTTDEWLDIKFAKPIPIYGITVQGHPVENKFVTSYKILYSEDGHSFSYVLDDLGQTSVFRGSVDQYKPVVQKFYMPVEARVVRIIPHTWHNGIAMKVELLGCQESLTTPSKVPESTTLTPPMIITPMCDEPMGVEEGLIFPEQISASSSSTELLPNLKLSSPSVWHPKLNNPHQFVSIDFLEPRNITGIATKGGEGTWTTVYKVFYSNDERQWNPIMDDNGVEMEFLGNFDSDTVKKNFFNKPLNARYLKVQPIRWHEQIGLKLEVLGCFLPYPVIVTTSKNVSPTPTPVQKCNVCDGVSKEGQMNCTCEEAYWWNGNSCVPKQECPCIVGHVLYNVGSIYIGEDCQECICTLGGTSFCQPKKCEPCQEPGMRPVINELCNCICKLCPAGTRHCPTSDVCIDENLWCDGVQNCPDDEKDCPLIESTTKLVTPARIEISTAVPTIAAPIQCLDPTCPPGYKTVIKAHRQTQHYSKHHWGHDEKSGRKNYSRTKGGPRKSTQHRTKHPHQPESNNETQCPQFTCVPIPLPPSRNMTVSDVCPEASCPEGYTVVYEKMSMYKPQKCPKYSCKPPAPVEAVCNVTGRTFNTFDGLQYKYDTCNHILARDMYFNKWYITLETQCKANVVNCLRVLVVTMDEYVIVLYPDMRVDINEYSFTPNQIAKIADKIPALKIATIGEVTYLVSNYYGFWVIWDSSSNAKIGISTKWARQVDGLCGYFDGYSMNDRQLPNGNQAGSTMEFGNSWALDEAPECDVQICPQDLRAKSWQINNIVKDRSLAECSNVLNVEKFVSDWFEDTCNCLRNNHTYDECRCRLLTKFVTDCQAGNMNVDLSTWRNVHDCPATCTPPFVHKDCFRNKCETSCTNLQQLEPCPMIQGVCFSGCFCPEGTVRNGEECVRPSQCRDCSCEWLGNSKFITFDRKNVKFDGNCTYVLSRNTVEYNKEPEVYSYQVLVSNGICRTGICTEAVIVLYKGHVVKIKEGEFDKEFEVELDGSKVHRFPANTPWLNLEQPSLEKLRLLIPSIQLEIISYQPNFAFTLNVPSHIFGGVMEGLCGNCNGDAEDDLRKQDGEITEDTEKFGASWLVEESLAGVNLDTSSCISKTANECVVPAAEQIHCRKLVDGLEFQMCHHLVDPMPYLTACQDSLCSGGGYCDSFEAYSRQCQQMGVCPIWRSREMCPYICPPHLLYKPCGSTCKDTCETVNQPRNLTCLQSYEEGCFCPDNFVFHNGTCIPKEECSMCDREGHINGDTWLQDVCTTCQCNDKVISCEKTVCPAVETICEENMSPVVVNGTEENCCPKYYCIPPAVTTVAPFCIEEPQMPECGYGQTTKVSVGSDGCKKFICECVPPSDCAALNEVTLEVEEVRPGFVQVTNTSGCCPRSSIICDPETCPAAPGCPEYHEVKANVEWNACCPTYSCTPPKDLCLYTPESGNRVEIVEEVVARKIGEQWLDGKCTSCTCELSDKGPKANCFTTECLKVMDHPDISDYVMEEVLASDKCCPDFQRTACRDQEKIYKVGEFWQPNIEDSCTLIQCVKDENGLQKQLKVQTCVTTCDPGFEYQPSDSKAISCCGRCIPVACVVDNGIKMVGEEWFSIDYCTKHSCVSNNGSIYVVSLTEKCPEIDPWEQVEFEIDNQSVEGQCCPQFIKTGCRFNGKVYKPGEKWKSLDDKCVTEICALESNVTKHKEIEVCNKDCPQGWSYEEQEGECCGKCRQMYCVVEDTLYEPGASWSSPDNCTTYSCAIHGEQLTVSSNSMVCPDITDCPVNMVYMDKCCHKCNISYSTTDVCAADVLEAQNTIGMFSYKHRVHGFCKNVQPIEGVTECRGKCESTSAFDTESWSPAVNCNCCQPTEYKPLRVELICENYKMLQKQVPVPVSCTCSSCSSSKSSYNPRKGGVKG